MIVSLSLVAGPARRSRISLFLVACPAAASALTVPAPTNARVLRAEAILPPGQSGFVSLTGLTAGTGSPHLYDQQAPFIAFKRRNFDFSRGGDEETPRPGSRSAATPTASPPISAATDADAWWGAGYAVAEDRLFELELFRRATTGRLAEILGRGYLDDDLIARRDYYTPAEMDAMLAAVPGELRSRVDAYRDGVNAYIAEVRLNPLLLPGEFAATGALPIAPWTRSRLRGGRDLPGPHRPERRRQRARRTSAR